MKPHIIKLKDGTWFCSVRGVAYGLGETPKEAYEKFIHIRESIRRMYAKESLY